MDPGSPFGAFLRSRNKTNSSWRNLGQPSRAWVNLLFEMGDKKKALKKNMIAGFDLLFMAHRSPTLNPL